jgi:purine-binding chemotaxis protein CheW
VATEGGTLFLVCRLGSELAVLPIAHVSETMRPLPVEPLADVPAFVLGLAVIRGAATPVVHVGRLLSDLTYHPTRFVLVKAGERRIVLAVEAVVGVRRLPASLLHDLPPLLARGAGGVIDGIGTLDSELFFVLESARLLPESTWAAIDAVEARP